MFDNKSLVNITKRAGDIGGNFVLADSAESDWFYIQNNPSDDFLSSATTTVCLNCCQATVRKTATNNITKAKAWIPIRVNISCSLCFSS